MTKTDPVRALRAFWEFEQKRVDETLDNLLSTPAAGSTRLFAAMRHAVLAPGKRFRPILCLAVYRAYDCDDPSIYPVAAALEMIHTYSLIHDDLPCMDDDDQRRGRPTVHMAFDQATAVLAGDALQALAFQLLSENASEPLVGLVGRAVGPMGMAGGQMSDLEAEGKDPTEDLVVSIHRAKTGRLIEASVFVGALKAGKGQFAHEERQPLAEYARALGLAFQVVDDILELTQSAEMLGKPIGSDLKHRKVTYPGAVGLARARSRAKELAEDAKSALNRFSGDPTLLRAIADYVISRDR